MLAFLFTRERGCGAHMPKTPKHTPVTQHDQHPDAWRRFERAVDAAVKGGPKHRPSKSHTVKSGGKKVRKNETT